METAARKEEQKFVNGVNVTALGETIEAIKDNPEIASFKFRARNKVVNGGLNRSEVGQFFGACQEHRADKAPFVLENDEPPVLLSGDKAPNPVEYILHALLGCMTTTTMYRAAGQGINIESIRSEIEGDLDLHGMMVLDPNTPAGFQEIRAKLIVKTNGPKETIKELHKSSPVFDTITRPVPVKVEVVFE